MCICSTASPGPSATGIRVALIARAACLALSCIGPVAGVESSTPEYNDVGLGPLRIASQSPGQSLRLGLVPRAPSNLPSGSWDVYVGSTWVNFWADKSEYQLDYEALTSELSVTYGVDSDWQVEGGLVVRTTFGGGMDGFIQGFHRSVGMGQGGRDEVEHGLTSIHIDASGSQPSLDLGKNDLQGATDAHVRATVQRTVVHDGAWHPSLALAFTAQLPIGSHDQYHGGDLDLGIDLIAAKRFGRCYGYATITFIRFGTDGVYGIELNRTNWSALAACEYRVTPTWSLIAQYLVSQGVAPDYHVFSEASHEITGGTKLAISDGISAEFGLIENLFVFDNSPDFGVHLAVRARF
jgi:hypothetical protein